MRLLLSFWSEARPEAPPRGPRDWRLFVALVALLLLEVTLRDDLGVGSPSALVLLGLLPAVLWRRSHPLLAAAIPFAATAAFDGWQLTAGVRAPDVHTQAFLLILPYALFRWGAGREVLLGLPIILVSASLGLGADDLSLAESLAGFTILLVPAAIGMAVRYRGLARSRELADARSSERLSLARELHDTVAHHVSAIAVRAQAGVALSAQDPGAAVEALGVIGEEASRTLEEMRAMVGLLRGDGEAQLAPTPRAEDLGLLTRSGDGGPEVVVALSGDVSAISPAVSQAAYRLAQESVTNARRHAVGARSIRVEVETDGAHVALRVSDDGERQAAAPAGYGLMGMAERAHLLGGSLTAGPGPERGWTVSAVLPDLGNGTTP